MKESFVNLFWLPSVIFISILFGVFGFPMAFFIANLLGILKIASDTFEKISERRWSLDYIAFLAMLISIVSHEYAPGAVVALMFSGGEALEAFAGRRAYSALKKLSDTIPKKCFVKKGERIIEIPIQEIKAGEHIIVKRGEIIPLDGEIISPTIASFNMANLTGESEPVDLKAKTHIKSGAINIGEMIELMVLGDFSTSTYHKIVMLVDEARRNPARIVSLSERANYYFTFITLLLSSGAYAFSSEISRALAVLVIATPCPLIIAAPAAFVSGMSRLAKLGIILRKPGALEGIANSDRIFFDKTGTLTLGEPKLVKVEVNEDSQFDERSAVAVASAIEIHSLHPLARAIINFAKENNINYQIASDIHESIGKGIMGSVNGERFSIGKSSEVREGITLSLKKLSREIAKFHFEDSLKEGVADLLSKLSKEGVKSTVITGDTKANADKVFKDISVDVFAEVSPEDKFRFIEEAHKEKHTVVMIGDGLNDAPALARADVGVVFSGSENGASIEAAQVVMLDHRIEKLKELFDASRYTMKIVKQSVYGGIALSSVGMIFASFGFIEPVYGAFIQEAIDVIVILNALRALRR